MMKVRIRNVYLNVHADCKHTCTHFIPACVSQRFIPFHTVSYHATVHKGTYWYETVQMKHTILRLSLSMDGAEVAVNCLCSVRSCATCWCPDNELADAHRGACKYRRMAEVMAQLDAERDALLDEHDVRVGLVKDVNEVEKRLRHKLLPRNAWRLIPFFELFMCSPKDELHQR